MVADVVLPQMGLEVSEGTIVTLHVAAGTHVAQGDPLVEVETDKALTDVVAPNDGVVVEIVVAVGDTVAVGTVLARLEDAAGAQDGRELAAVGVAEADAPRVRAAPVARRAAEHLGIPLGDVVGTGPRGRITLGDVEEAARERGMVAAEAAIDAGERRTDLSPTRRAIARRMTESQAIPQFSLARDIDATWLLAEKDRLSNDGPHKISVTDLLVQALAETVTRHPRLAAAYVAADGGEPQLLVRAGVDVGLAVATDRGLLVPVMRDAHARTLGDLALDRVRLVAEARAGRLERAEMAGATVTLSSLAAFGVDSFVAMLNPGESAILAVGRAVERVVPSERGIAVVPTLTLTFTLDHRVVDGAAGGRAIAELAALLEGGMTWRE